MIQQENGVTYTRDRDTAIEYGWGTAWHYRIYANTRLVDSQSIYTASHLDALLLVNYWNDISARYEMLWRYVLA